MTSSPITELTIRRPDDWHLHLRDGAMLAGVIGDTTRHFARAIIMPNLVPPVVTTEDATAYRARIMAAGTDMPVGETGRGGGRHGVGPLCAQPISFL